ILRNGVYANASGTSMAGPHVAGVVALILSSAPKLKGQVEIVENILRQSARPAVGDKVCNGIDTIAIPNNTFGHGRLDAMKAIQLAKEYQSTAINNGIPSNIKLYPNPAENFIFVDGVDNGTFEYYIYDLSGKIVLYGQQEHKLISFTESITNGLYFCRIVLEGNVFMSTLLINKS
ncbi:MAG TPA: S8 family peptidase, partial [Saprospiraceae bacterium]|nr:S8 family peptidase [Saprospiraceae bacterium]